MAITAWGQVFQVHQASFGKQDESQITALKDRGFVSVWRDADDNGGKSSIKAQIFNGDGTPRGAEFIASLDDGPNHSSLYPEVTVLQNGEIIIAYSADNASGGTVRVGAFSPTGEALGAQITLSDNSTNAGNFEFTALSDGRLMVAYEEGNIGPISSVASVRDGRLAWGESFFDGQNVLALGSLDNDRFAQITQDAIGYLISVRSAAGEVISPPVRAHTTTDAIEAYPALTRLTDGRLAFAFIKKGSDDEVRVQLLDSNGTLIGTDILADTGRLLEAVTVDELPNGGFAVSSTNFSGTRTDLRIKLYDSGGNRTGEHVIEDVWVSNEPALTVLADGRIVVSWDKLDLNGDVNIYSQVLDPRTERVVTKGSAFNDQYFGTQFGDSLAGAGGSDKLKGEAGNDILDGGAGDDILTGGAGNDALAGGAGSNTAIFSGNKVDYTITRAVDGKWVITDTVADRDGTDTLSDIRLLKFADTSSVTENTAPSAAKLSQTQVSETAPINEAIATLSATDPEGDKISYELASDGPFAVRGDKLILTGPLDYEKRTSYALKVTAIDEYGARSETTVQVSVLNVIEANALRIDGTRAADYLAGENGNDTIYGAAGNDALNGFGGNDRLYGGLGKDKLAGEIGKDVFVFKEKADARKTHVDKIIDFNVKDDTIWLDNAVFKKLGSRGSESKPAALKSGYFKVGSAATDANDYIIYDKKKGILYYDADGNGAGKALQIATLSKNLKMTYKDFFVI